MLADIRDYSGLTQVLVSTFRLVRILGWVLLSLLWLACLGLIGLGLYVRWSLGETTDNVLLPLASIVGLIACSLHVLCGLWPFSRLPWLPRDA